MCAIVNATQVSRLQKVRFPYHEIFYPFVYSDMCVIQYEAKIINSIDAMEYDDLDFVA